MGISPLKGRHAHSVTLPLLVPRRFDPPLSVITETGRDRLHRDPYRDTEPERLLSWLESTTYAMDQRALRAGRDGDPLDSRSDRVAAIGIGLVHADARSKSRPPTRGSWPDVEPFDRAADHNTEGLVTPWRKAPSRRPLHTSFGAALETRCSGCRLGRLLGCRVASKSVTQRLLVWMVE